MIAAPLLSEDVDIEINDDDLRIDTYRASGAGGQREQDRLGRPDHASSDRMVVQCQNERSQSSNKQTALRLKSMLAERAIEEREAELAKERGEVRDTDFGSQIRSYVLQPYQMVKDHRTDHEAGNAQGVLDGDLDGFVHSYLLAKAAGKVR